MAGHSLASGGGYPVPVLFLIFNRPVPTARVFEAIARARPKELYIAADGPRVEHPTDAVNCSAAREILKKIDWPCEVRTLFRTANLGCRTAISSAIDWFFENVEQGVILEDDCLPSAEFFTFCEQLLSLYSQDPRIMQIAGTNLCPGTFRDRSSYTFSGYTPIWGWATWRRAWKHYDVEMSQLGNFKREGRLRQVFSGWEERLHRRILYDLVQQRKIDTWDYQWNFALTAHNGLSIIPVKSLIQNIGFGADATHTKGAPEPAESTTQEGSVFPLRHPLSVESDSQYDRAYFRSTIRRTSSLSRLLVKRWMPREAYVTIKRWMS